MSFLFLVQNNRSLKFYSFKNPISTVVKNCLLIRKFSHTKRSFTSTNINDLLFKFNLSSVKYLNNLIARFQLWSTHYAVNQLGSIQNQFVFFENSRIRLRNRQRTPFENANSNQQDPKEQPPEQDPNRNGNPFGSIPLIAFCLLIGFLVDRFTRQNLERTRQLMEEKKSQSVNGTQQPSTVQTKQQSTLNLNIKNGNVISWNDFVSQLLANKLVSQIYATKISSYATIVLKNPIEVNGHKYNYFFVNVLPDDIEKKLTKAQDELNLKTDEKITVTFKSSDAMVSIADLLSIIFACVVVFYFTRFALSKVQSFQSDITSQFTKARFTVVDPHLKAGVPKITFKDVAGLHEAKVEIKEFVEYLRSPDRFIKLGAKVPKGALLLGPPGCGKTLLAKAVAAEANVPFFNIAGTEFIEMIGGVGAARVRSLFEEAKKQSPSIIYIDEIDAIGRKRSGNNDATGGSGELDQTLNQMLVSMDGLESNSNVVVIASTNRADILDKALLRPGRLDRHITIDLPTYDERIEILNVHMRNLKLEFKGKEKDDFISQLSHLTPRFSGADLANVCNEAALLAARDGQQSITKRNFEAALERVLAGPEKKTSSISAEDRKLLAYRECGHVIVSWFHKSSDLILKVSLLTRAKTSTFTQYLPSDKKLYSREELFDQMCLYFGGRVTESLIFNRFTTKSEEDLKKITKLAYAQVESFGMNEVVGNVSFPTQQEERATKGSVGIKPYSRKLRSIIDLEVSKLVAQANEKATQTVNKHIDKLHLLAEELLKKENLNYEDIVQLLGPPENPARYKTAKKTENISSPI